MNIKLFKKLIKDTVTEAIYEELPNLINEALVKHQKQQLTENRTVNFTSKDVMSGGLPADARRSLMSKMGAEFGFQQPTRELKVIDAVDEGTGEKINPFSAFIEDAAANMTPMDRSGLRQLD